uniref:Uncharacterized protein n=1 Tax=Triticum urartu TaxID=4572 RepID=A0A8R7V6T8_TRIUA
MSPYTVHAAGLAQYTHLHHIGISCIHIATLLLFIRQAMHCALKFCQYPGGKCRSTVFGAGCPSSSIRSMFSLQKQGRSSGKFLHSPLQPHILLCVNLYPTPMLLGFVPLLF